MNKLRDKKICNRDLSFYLLKPETYLFGKKKFIEHKIASNGLNIIKTYEIRLSFADLLKLYPGKMARITMSLRLPHFMKLDLCLVQGPNAIEQLNKLKYNIRNELLGLKLGGFLHAPDSQTEFNKHMAIFSRNNNIQPLLVSN